MNFPRVSIIIVALNEAGNLAKTLEGLRQMDCEPGEFEVIVVDGGSTDGTAEVARNADAKLIVAPGKNIPQSRNIGLANATAPVIAFIDADCVVDRQWLRQGLKYFEGGQDVLVGSWALPPHNGTWVQRLWADHILAKAIAMRKEANMYRLLTTRNLFTTRRIMDAVGGFDEALTTGEDYYFCYKVQKHGFPLKYDFDIAVTHIGEPATLRDFFHEQIWHASNVVWRRLLKAGEWGGLNPLYFGLGMAICLFGIVAGVILGALGFGWTLAMASALVLAGGLIVLSVRTALQTGKWQRAPGYFILYFLYGLARVITLWPGTWIARKKRK